MLNSIEHWNCEQSSNRQLRFSFFFDKYARARSRSLREVLSIEFPFWNFYNVLNLYDYDFSTQFCDLWCSFITPNIVRQIRATPKYSFTWKWNKVDVACEETSGCFSLVCFFSLSLTRSRFLLSLAIAKSMYIRSMSIVLINQLPNTQRSNKQFNSKLFSNKVMESNATKFLTGNKVIALATGCVYDSFRKCFIKLFL